MVCGEEEMYYCKNCGEPYQTDEAVLCTKCGVSKGMGGNYCRNCGKPVTPETAVCLSCGVPNTMPVPYNAKSRVTAGILALFLGCFGAHNFYLGYIPKAIVQLAVSVIGMLLLCVFIGVFPLLGMWCWGVVEGILLLTGKISTDGGGRPLID